MDSLKELYKIGRGPSSSHTMGPERAARDFIRLVPNADGYRVIFYGSLASTGKGHLSDFAVSSVLGAEKTQIIFEKQTQQLPHPNTMRICAVDSEGNVVKERTYLSVGGGSIRALDEKEERSRSVYPFCSFREIREACEREGLTIDEFVFRYDDGDIKDYLKRVWRSMQDTIARGLNKTGELPGDLHILRKAKTLSFSIAGESAAAREKRTVCSYAFATAEENASGGTVVTAPTCGASGVLPAVLQYLNKRLDLSEETVVSALATAGLVGNVVKRNASVSGAEAGCQAEIGTATAMAAAAACRIYGYSLEETEYAAEIALEHQLGLTCDPVHGYVQIPCIERNAVAALRALDSAELAHVLSGTRKISFDLIVKTMYETGRDLNARYRETSEGGLAETYGKGC